MRNPSTRLAIEDYEASLVMAPMEYLAALDVVRVDGACPAVLLVDVDLWTKESGQSDLTLELRLTDIYEGVYDIEVLDLHVL